MTAPSVSGRVPFSLTFVTYSADDQIVGQIAALFSLLPIFAIVAYVTLIVARRELLAASTLFGQLLNLILNFVLKRAINLPRPPGSDHTGPGMPSDHAQFSFFLAVFVCWWLSSGQVKLSTSSSPMSPSATLAEKIRTVLRLGMLLLAVLVGWSRVYLGYHTVLQVVVGALIGAMTGSMWWMLTELYLRPQLYPALEATAFAKMCCVKDSSNVPDVMRVEYQASLHARQKRL